MNKVYRMNQLRRAIQLFVLTLEDESTIMEVADIYPIWEAGKAYKNKAIVKYGVNSVGDTQLWQIIGDHTSQAHYPPDVDITHYKTIGVSEGGIAIWTQPLGGEDTYMKGDKVSYKGEIWESVIDYNAWSPDDYPAGWKKL